MFYMDSIDRTPDIGSIFLINSERLPSEYLILLYPITSCPINTTPSSILHIYYSQPRLSKPGHSTSPVDRTHDTVHFSSAT